MHSKGSRSQMTAYPLSRTLLELQNPFFLGAWSLAGNRLMFLPRRDQQARMIAQIEKCNIELLCMNLSWTSHAPIKKCNLLHKSRSNNLTTSFSIPFVFGQPATWPMQVNHGMWSFRAWTLSKVGHAFQQWPWSFLLPVSWMWMTRPAMRSWNLCIKFWIGHGAFLAVHLA